MLVVAALRWVDNRPGVDPLTGAVRTDVRTSGPSAADRCALEYALRLAAAGGGRCVAVSVAPEAADAMLRQALAAGADEALRVAVPEGGPDLDDGSATAALLAGALGARYGRVDVVLCGDHSLDRGTGATPAFLADRLGAAQALGLRDLTLDGADRLRAVRRLDGGRQELLSVPLPAVCSVEAGDTRLRTAALPALLASGSATIPWVPGDTAPGPVVRVRRSGPYRPRPRVLDAPGGSDPRDRWIALTGTLTGHRASRVVRPADAGAAADELLAYLGERGYLERPGER
ncbi:mycofactocin-associated electron transfer flavoprotein beta subunit [Micromonospora sp. CPCC 205711]|uniref:mycofactocin-associated electron transfer flavoprotein beta subunit n=1 Tax=Micromonospora sp. CPCC 205547 TaxID=3122400 RepID=UPI002FF28878